MPPIYEYSCEKCKEVFELERPIRLRKYPVNCPTCSSDKVERLISRCDFALKGGGWGSSGYSQEKSKDKEGENKS